MNREIISIDSACNGFEDAVERSIVANIADEIKVSISGNDVEIIIDKQF